MTGRPASHRHPRANIIRALKANIPLRIAIITPNGEGTEETRADLETLGVQRIGVDTVRLYGRGNPAPEPDCSGLCGACGDNRASIGPDGTVSPCVFSTWMSTGNVRQEPLADILTGPDMTQARNTIAAGKKDDEEDDGHVFVPCEPDDWCSPGSPGALGVSATPATEDSMIPFTDLIHPHTGDVHKAQLVDGGHSWSTTFLLNSEMGKFFVKGVPNRPGGRLDSARREADINPFVRGLSPTMRWRAEDEKWFVMGFDVIEGRPADFLPGSVDLNRVAVALNRVSALPFPQVALEWEENRWDRFATEEDRKHLAGDSLTYTDIHGNNVLLAEDQTWLIDWAWPTRGASVITPSCWAVQLISAGHSPESALSWVSRLDAWKESTPESIAAFTRADVRQYEWQVEARPGQDWLKAMLDAAKVWHQHLKK